MPPATLPVLLRTAGLLALSNVFMTFAWYAHLKELAHRPWIVAALIYRGIACSSTCCKCPRIASAQPR